MHYAKKIENDLYDDTKTSTIRTAIYARVSTTNDGQKESCENQVKTANDFINEHKNISIKSDSIFVDDGITGKSITHRDKYKKLMSLVNHQDIDLIIVKTGSRLFRSPLEAQLFLKTLVVNQVALLTLENRRLWDFEDQSDVILFSILSVFDASVSYTQSEAGRIYQKRRCKDKKLQPKDVMPGYTWDSDKKDIEIDVNTAEYIKFIFEEYVYKAGTVSSIHSLLIENNMAFLRKRRDKETKEHYEERYYLSKRTISNILKNPKYIGIFYINKKGSQYINGQESRRFDLPEKEWVLVERKDLQIIDNDIFEMAQRIHNSRINNYACSDKEVIQARFRGTHTYSSLVFCPICQKPYVFNWRDRKKTIGKYYIKKHSDCSNSVNMITEENLNKIVRKSLKTIIGNNEEIMSTVESILLSAVEESQNCRPKTNNLVKQKKIKERQIDNLENALAEGSFEEKAFNSISLKMNRLHEDVEQLNKDIELLEKNTLDASFVKKTKAKLQKSINEFRNFMKIDRKRALTYIERIEVRPSGDIDLFFKSFVSTDMLRTNHSDSIDFKENRILLTNFDYSYTEITRFSKTQKTIKINCYM